MIYPINCRAPFQLGQGKCVCATVCIMCLRREMELVVALTLNVVIYEVSWWHPPTHPFCQIDKSYRSLDLNEKNGVSKSRVQQHCIGKRLCVVVCVCVNEPTGYITYEQDINTQTKPHKQLSQLAHKLVMNSKKIPFPLANYPLPLSQPWAEHMSRCYTTLTGY